MSQKINLQLNLIKNIRKKTGAGVLECKSALEKFSGNVDLATSYIKENKKNKLAERYDKKTQSGSIGLGISEDKTFGVLIKIKCETEFLAKSYDFLKFQKRIVEIIIRKKISDIDSIKKYSMNEISEIMSRSKENVEIEGIITLTGKRIYGYSHRNKIGALVYMENSNDLFGRQIAMQIVANRTKYIDKSEISQKTLEKKRKMEINHSKNSKKNIFSNKIFQNDIDYNLENLVLMEQTFIFNTTKKVKELVKENNSKIVKFITIRV
ncbi:translation elongation factor Ts [Candidatus Riesia pediculischaeffi]|uniref:Elongation factor Ts n=1 Tax=Candidatus Riesia pediculischaeffi PTSU TaxID=1401651 RepID=A0A0C1V869_9ENTR|nr:translation elongation factor Ts [Candidatus Riesia pediculischaeffi]KIE64053.1 Translation elongation factor Ts [Candidatus Riesia pediculischaeffi PTSU]